MFPCAWGPIFTAETTYARGRDFGNYESAELVVQKELEPSADPGRFDLLVSRRVVVAAAGNGARRVVALAPGTYTVSEVAVAGTNPADYRSSVECKREARRTQRRAGGLYERLHLSSRERVVCTFRNVRPGSPAIDIDKTGPATAEAGDTLRYTLYVTNPGDLPFPADSVRVTDPACDSPPALVGKADAAGTDDSPGTLDPGDTWTYACSRKTNAASDCQPTVVPNTATVTGTTGGSSVTDSSTIEMLLRCPPTAPIPPQPQPQPEATRIARVQVYVNAQLRRRLTVQSLQRRVTPRVQVGPGRHRVSVRVTFQRGTGSPPVTLRRIVRVCGASRPPFTG
jgi:uncharacterized repeat protein (TIGR01451 family)